MVATIYKDRCAGNTEVVGWAEVRTFAQKCNTEEPMWAVVVNSDKILYIESLESDRVKIRFKDGGAEVRHYTAAPLHAAMHRPAKGAA